ncbi:MAG: hypothetical protein AB7F86_04030 [Bdellovibrionales bacterium]
MSKFISFAVLFFGFSGVVHAQTSSGVLAVAPIPVIKSDDKSLIGNSSLACLNSPQILSATDVYIRFTSSTDPKVFKRYNAANLGCLVTRGNSSCGRELGCSLLPNSDEEYIERFLMLPSFVPVQDKSCTGGFDGGEGYIPQSLVLVTIRCPMSDRRLKTVLDRHVGQPRRFLIRHSWYTTGSEG